MTVGTGGHGDEPGACSRRCHPVSRGDGQGSRDKGFPNLTDKDWQWGREPEQISRDHIQRPDRRHATLRWQPARRSVAAGAKEVANYVRSLSGLSHNSDLAAKGKAKLETIVLCLPRPGRQGDAGTGSSDLTATGSTAVRKPRSSRRLWWAPESDAGLERVSRRRKDPPAVGLCYQPEFRVAQSRH